MKFPERAFLGSLEFLFLVDVKGVKNEVVLKKFWETKVKSTKKEKHNSRTSRPPTVLLFV